LHFFSSFAFFQTNSAPNTAQQVVRAAEHCFSFCKKALLLQILIVQRCPDLALRQLQHHSPAPRGKIMRRSSKTTTDINAEIQRLIDRAQELIDATADEADDKVKAARSALMRGLDSAREESGRLYDRAVDKASEADEYIHDKPYGSSSFQVDLRSCWIGAASR
jgi:ElaB/YqjD/DUF883 family membrane-anchored ribosome-binding protein